jgi:hypothetical protein
MEEEHINNYLHRKLLEIHKTLNKQLRDVNQRKE